jgi:peptidoglycan/xylan/chitin deacetylase (PgdA/CDA1 family)
VAWHAARQVPKVLAAGVDVMHRPPAGLVVLIYHRVGRRTAIEVDLPLVSFTEQVTFLAAHPGVVSLAEGLARLADPDAPRVPMIAVTFDDGTADVTDLAVPVLVEHGVPATLYIATEFVDRARELPDGGVPTSWSALRDAASTGIVTIGSHTHSHALLDGLEQRVFDDELDRSIDLIGEHLGVRPHHFAYPKALPGSPAATTAVRARFQSAALAGTRVNPYTTTDPYRLARSPVQQSDGKRWFHRKAAGGLAVEDTLRGVAHRVRDALVTR